MIDSKIHMRDAFLDSLYEFAKSDRNIILISNDFGAPALDSFRRELPMQFINAGISEQNIISVAAGLTLKGKKTFVYSIASFITLRCYEQIKIDLCVMKIPVTIIGVGPGYAYDVDGPTHHATEDIAIMRALANMQILCPSDSHLAASFVKETLKSEIPTYVRIDRGAPPILYRKSTNLKKGFSVILEGKDLCIIGCGITVHIAMDVARMLKEKGINPKVVDLYRLKPINKFELVKILKMVRKIFTIEEHTINGGLGSLIVELLVDASMTLPVKRCAVSDELLYAYGTRDMLHCARRLDKESLVRTVEEWVLESESSKNNRYSRRR